jgi:hypothetical protein
MGAYNLASRFSTTRTHPRGPTSGIPRGAGDLVGLIDRRPERFIVRGVSDPDGADRPQGVLIEAAEAAYRFPLFIRTEDMPEASPALQVQTSLAQPAGKQGPTSRGLLKPDGHIP